jgi:putative endonuclease
MAPPRASTRIDARTPGKTARPRAAHLEAGEAAEDFALARLRDAGLALLARNVRFPFGELDLVMHEGATLVFVEVRKRRSAAFGGGLASVDRGKRRKLARAAQAWLCRNAAWSQAPCRFDVVALSPRGLEWRRAAFTLDDLW